MRSRQFLGVRIASILALASGLFLPASPLAAQTHSLVIAQVYGAGGLSGANFRQDFIELFNPTSASITANAWAIQIRSSTGNAAFTVYQLPNFTLKPGQFYLITGSSPTLSTYGAVTPIAADYELTSQFPGPASTTLNIISSTTQTIALTSSITPIPTGDSGAVCPALTATNFVDIIGFGASNCFAGTGPAPNFATNDFILSGYTAARSTTLSRINRCINQNDNSRDFVVTPLTTASYVNTTSMLQPCPGTQLLSSASVDPGVVYAGGSVLFTASVTPSATPSGTIASVTINLEGIGGSLTQQMFDNGTNGDVFAGDGIYSYNATVAATAMLGSHIPVVTVTDSLGNVSLAPVSFLVTNNRQTAAIHTIQTGAPTNSANNGVVYTTSGIVTGVRAHGFYLQAKDSAIDSDPTTSEAIFVNTVSSGPPTSAVIGNELQVTGVLTVAPATSNPTSSSAPYYGTELDSPTAISVLSTGNTLPTPILIAPSMAASGSTYGQRYQYQSMLVSVPSATVISGTSGVLTETTETYASDGRFYGVLLGTPRPFREPGLSLADPIPYGGPATVQNFDGNPEALWFDSGTLGGSVMDVTTGTTVSNVVAIDDYSTGAEQLLISAATRPTFSTLNTAGSVPAASSTQFAVASQDMQRFFSTLPAAGGVTITSEAYQRRLAKSSLSIRKTLQSPAIIAVQGIDINALNALATKVNSDAVSAGDAIKPSYSGSIAMGDDALGNGFLVDTNRVAVISTSGIDSGVTFTNANGTQSTLFDDPITVLTAQINATSTTAAQPVTIINVNFANPSGETLPTTASATLRSQRQQQAQTIAGLEQLYQNNGLHVIVAGNFGAPEFSDGVVDVVGIAKGAPTAASQLVLGTSSSYIAPSPNLIDLTTSAPSADRYSITQFGSTEAMDHILVSTNNASGYVIYAHDNTDFPAIDRNDAARPERNAEHDATVAYFTLPALSVTSSAALNPSSAQDFGSVPITTASTGQDFTFTNIGNVVLTGVAVSITGDFSQANTCTTTLAVGASCSINVAFTPTITGLRTGTLTIVSSSILNPSLGVTLTGTGSTAPVAKIFLTPSSADFGALVLNNTSAAATFLLTNTGPAISSIQIATSGDYSMTTSCGATLGSCASCSIFVAFTPTATGSRDGTLTVTTSSATTPTLTSTLTGQGLATLSTTATVAPTVRDFGTVNVGVTSAPYTFTFANTGTSSMTGMNVTTTGDFAVASNTCGWFLNPAETCTITVTFHPTAPGTRLGTLNIVSGSVVIPSITTIATLSGNGFSAATGTTLTPTSADFGTIVLGASSNATIFTYTNIGGSSIGSIAVSITGAGYAQTNNCPTSLTAGKSCSISVIFSPMSPGAVIGALTVNSNSTANPSLSSALTGTGAAVTTTVGLTPTTQDFGSINVGATSPDYNFNFTNTGNTSISNLSIGITGQFQQSSTSATGGNNCPTTLPAGQSCTIILTFNPTSPGPASGLLTITSSSTSSPSITATLTGTGIGVTIPTDTVTLTPTTQDFGSVTIGSSSTSFPFTLTATGNTNISNISISVTGPFAYAPSNGTNCTTTLTAGASCAINLIFTPAIPGAATGMLVVTSSSTTFPSVASTLTGTGVTAVVPTDTLTLTPTTQDFASITVSSQSAAFPFTLTNTGNTTVTNILVAHTGPFASSVSNPNTCNTSLTAGASCILYLVFAPTGTGPASGTLTVTSSSTTTPSVTSTLSGTGIAVTQPSFTLTASTTTTSIAPGTPVSFTATIASINSYVGTVNLTCAGAPAYSTCKVSPTSVTLTANGSTTATVNITTFTLASSLGLRSGLWTLLSLGSLGVLLLAGIRGRRLLDASLFLLLLFVTIGTVGCISNPASTPVTKGPTTYNTPPGTYTYTVTATDGTTTKTLPFTVIIQ